MPYCTKKGKPGSPRQQQSHKSTARGFVFFNPVSAGQINAVVTWKQVRVPPFERFIMSIRRSRRQQREREESFPRQERLK